MDLSALPNPIIVLAGLAAISLAPFVAILVSSFIKIVVVILLLRNALGLQQIPPNLAINGLAMILSAFVMTPIAVESYRVLSQPDINWQALTDPTTQEALAAGIEPLREFMKKHSNELEREFFANSARELWPPEYANEVDGDHMMVLIPAYITSQLASAFEIGFLLFMPFLAIDLIVSNILLAMGMMMVSPLVVSLPFKLLLFVLADGWTRLIHGLVMSYQ